MNSKKINEIKTSLPILQSYIFSDIKTYKKFLRLAGYTYEYTFENQLMIFKYNPYAKSCATFEQWTSEFDRRINSKSQGIPVIIDGKLEYLFDSSSTSKKYDYQPDEPVVWQLDDNNTEKVTAELQYDFTNANHIANAIRLETNKLTFKSEAQKKLILNSVAYVVCERCGVNGDELIDDDIVSILKSSRSNTVDIGNYVNRLSRTFLQKIENCLDNNTERTDNHERENHQRNSSRADTRHGGMVGRHTVRGERNVYAGRERGSISVLSDFNGKADSRGDNSGNADGFHGRANGIGNEHRESLQPGTSRELGNGVDASFSENAVLQRGRSLDIGQNGSSVNEIRSDRSEAYEDFSKRAVQGFENVEDVGIVSGEARRYLSTENRSSDGANNEKRRSERRTSEERLDEIQSDVEHEQAGSGGNNPSGNDLRSVNSNAAGTTIPAVTFYNKDQNIIGTVNFRYIKAKRYRKFDTPTAIRIAEQFEKSNISYSGKIEDNFTTLTFSNDDMLRCKAIISQIERSLQENAKELKHSAARLNPVTDQYNSLQIIKDVQKALKDLYNDDAHEGEVNGGYDWKNFISSLDVVSKHNPGEIRTLINVSGAVTLLQRASEMNSGTSTEKEYTFANEILEKIINDYHSTIINPSEHTDQLSVFDNFVPISDTEKKLADNAEDNILLVNDFKKIAVGSLQDNLTIRNAHQNSDNAEFQLEVHNAVNDLLTDLIAGNQQIEGYAFNDISVFYDKFFADETMQKDIYRSVIEDVDTSLQQLEKARIIAKEQGIPFSDKFSNGLDDDDPNIYTYDGGMSPEDFYKWQLLNELAEITGAEDGTPYKLIETFEQNHENAENLIFEILNDNELAHKVFTVISNSRYMKNTASDSVTKSTEDNLPTITCEWSESNYFEDGKTYTVYEFDKLMKQADDEMVAGAKAAIEKYGSSEAWYSSNDYDEFTQFKGYNKVKFTLNMPNGTSFTERQDVGDGYGGVIDFLRQYSSYKSIIPLLESVRDLQKAEVILDKTISEKAQLEVAQTTIEAEKKSEVTNYKETDFTGNQLSLFDNSISFEESKNEHQTIITSENQIDSEAAEPRTNIESLKKQFVKYSSDNTIYGKKTYERLKNALTENSIDVRSLEKNDYHIFETAERYGAKTNFRNNITAIRLLKQIESENRFADSKEQQILAKYVGWGGLPQAFSHENEKWKKEYIELKDLLTEKEYRDAATSTLSSFYTDYNIINQIYDCLINMGFEYGSILEPSAGIGNFIGSMPVEMYKQSKITAIELDSIAARIAKLLYPSANVQINGFEKTQLEDNSFDLAIGNVPFGGFSVFDPKYDSHKFMLHDYFFAKSIDKVRPGGIVAFITSTGTMDKKSTDVRKYIDERAEFIGAVRLPGSAFATTEASADIIFLKVRKKPEYTKSEWIETDIAADGFTINKYFLYHPEMVLGKRVAVNKMYGRSDSAMYVPFDNNIDISDLLHKALQNIKTDYNAQRVFTKDKNENGRIKAPEHLQDTRNYSYIIFDDKLAFYKDGYIDFVNVTEREESKYRQLIAVRDSLRKLIALQLNESTSDEQLNEQRNNLSAEYDKFVKKFGYINSRNNINLFKNDNSAMLLTSLEIFNDKGFERKADIFFKRTISPRHVPDRADSAYEALIISMSEKARVDIDYISDLCGKSYQEVIDELRNVIYPNPEKFDGYGNVIYELADEYLSGDIREKLSAAKKAAEKNPLYEANINALNEAMPQPLTAAEIEVRLGATWIDHEYIRQFVYELLQTPVSLQYLDTLPPRLNNDRIDIEYSEFTARWNVSNFKRDNDNVRSSNIYGTQRISAYEIIQKTLNLHDIKVYDTYYDSNGKPQKTLNKSATIEAQQKQTLICQEFKNWIFRDSERRNKLVAKYNRLFNSIRPRTYDGSFLKFVGMNPEIQLKKHQKDAVAHGLFGGNELLAHVVGAGKTFEMAAIVMEGKRLGLHNKSLIVVPNHITEQFADEFMNLYPGANLLVAKKTDFAKENRRALFGKIATGDYDAVIIGHSQLINIPMSQERQVAFLERQLDDITTGLAEVKYSRGETFQIKQMERTRKTLEEKLKKLTETPKRDNIVTFEEMGIDKLVIDEAHAFKNLYLHTKMNNVAGLSAAGAAKTEDLYMKCEYINEKTNCRGLVFATGTPLTKSITEIYTLQRYLQPEYLKKTNLYHFDSWASTFGETVTATELAPEGTGYRLKTRFSRFYNLPELMAAFKLVADIKTSDMLNLPVPKCNVHNISAEPSEIQEQLIKNLSKRAAKIHSGEVNRDQDNMLNITNDGRKIGLDQRIINSDFEDNPNSKVNLCVKNVYKIWHDTADNRLTQLIFCDFSTPTGKSEFNIYDDIRNKLIAQGVPRDEIAFIHDYNTEIRKKNLFEKVRSGDIRILLGSTAKMGAGTNVQNKLIATHDLDAPWNPSDLEQRLGRMVRRGNTNDEVNLYRYVTKNTFDAYLFQMLENKQRPISQIMTSRSAMRSCDDIDEAVLNYAEVKALCAGNPLIKEKMELDIEITKLQSLKASYLNNVYRMEDDVLNKYPKEITFWKSKIYNLQKDIDISMKYPIFKDSDNKRVMTDLIINGVTFTSKNEAVEAINQAIKKALDHKDTSPFAHYRGFDVAAAHNPITLDDELLLSGNGTYRLEINLLSFGIITKMDNCIKNFSKELSESKKQLGIAEKNLAQAKEEIKKPFLHDSELNSKLKRAAELTVLLELNDKTENGLEKEEKKESVRKKIKENQAIIKNRDIQKELLKNERPEKICSGE